MLQELMSLIPQELGAAAAVYALAGVGVGLVLWILGARMSRAWSTLALLAAGAIVGMELPRWYGWQISGAGPAVGGAVVFGFLGYALHALWVSVELGALLAAWASLVTWALLHGVTPMTWPVVNPAMSRMDLAHAAWSMLPPDVARLLPYAAGFAMLSGVVMGLLWPRVATVLLWSLIGTTLMAGFGVISIRYVHPQWATWLPAQTTAQVTAFLGLVALGSFIQWRLAPLPGEASDAKAGAAPGKGNGKGKPADEKGPVTDLMNTMAGVP
jgi:hypothetical protein